MGANEETIAIASAVETIVRELAAAGSLRAGQLLVIGTSTSEVLGGALERRARSKLLRKFSLEWRLCAATLAFIPCINAASI